MTGIQSLSDHAKSGSHIKNVETLQQKRLPFSNNYSLAKIYDPNSLQYTIARSGSAVIGCQMIEEYKAPQKAPYYKCILCGTYGRKTPMFNHVIGDKHTDKYIRSRCVLENLLVITSKEREYLRRRIEEEEPYTVKDIRVIKGEKFYPSEWEDAGKPQKQRASSVSSDNENVCMEVSIKTKFSPERPLVESNKVDKAIQAYSCGFLSNILLKMNFIVQTHMMDKFDLRTVEDLKVALNLMNYALHQLYFVNRFQKLEAKESEVAQLTEQKQVIESCLGYVYERMLNFYFKNHLNINWQYDT